MKTQKRKLIAAASLCAAIAVPSLSFGAPLCSLSTLGLQAHAAAQYNDAGCIVGGDSILPVVNEASSDHAYAFAITSYGINSASVSGNLPVEGGTTNASAWSIWTDTISITGGTGTGEVTFGVHLSGTFTDHTETNFTLAINQGAGGNFTGATTRGIYSQTPGGTSSLSVDVTLPYVFTYDVPFTLTSWLDLSGYLNSNCCGGIDAMLPFSADFSHTAILDTVILPTGASLNSSSGVSYPAQLTAVPVPAAAWLFGSGLLGLVGASGKRRRC